MKTPLPYQQQGIDFLLRQKLALLWDEQGLGKTYQAIWAGETPALVVCPLYLADQWVTAIRELTGQEARRVDSKEVPMEGWVVCNYERLKYVKGVPRTLIVDEASYIKNPKSKRSKAVLELGKNAKRIYVLTGTPIINRPIELWPILLLLRQVKQSQFFPWAIKYCGAYQHEYGWDFSGVGDTEGLHEQLKKFALRREKKDVLPQLPPKRYTTIRVGANDGARKAGLALDDLVRAGVDLTSPSGIGARQHLRVEAALSKLEAVNAWLDDYLAGTSGKVVVFSGFKAPLEELAGRRGDCVVIHGDIGVAERGRRIDDFKGHGRVLCITYGVGTFGLNLQEADTVVILDLPWTPAEMEQAEDRVHRMGQEKPVLIVRFLTDLPIEATILEALDMKADVIEAIKRGNSLGLTGLADLATFAAPQPKGG